MPHPRQPLRICPTPRARPPQTPPHQRKPHPRQPLRICPAPGGDPPRSPPPQWHAASAAAVKDQYSPRGRAPGIHPHEGPAASAAAVQEQYSPRGATPGIPPHEGPAASAAAVQDHGCQQGTDRSAGPRGRCASYRRYQRPRTLAAVRSGTGAWLAWRRLRRRARPFGIMGFSCAGARGRSGSWALPTRKR